MRRMRDMRRPNYLTIFSFLTHYPAISYVALFDIQSVTPPSGNAEAESRARNA